MAGIIDSLFLELGFDTSKITKGQKEASAAVRKTSEEFEKHGKVIEKRAALFGEAVGTSTLKLLGLFATMLMGGKAAREFSQYITDADAAIGRSARNIQVSKDTLFEWQTVVKESGGSAEDATSSIKALSTNIANMKIGHVSTEFVEAWARIGALGGKTMDWSKGAEANLPVIAENLRNIAAKDGPAVALQLAKMLGLTEGFFNAAMKASKASLEAMKNFAPGQGDIDRAQKLQQSLVDTQTAGSYLGRVFSAILAPAMLKYREAVRLWSVELGNWLVKLYPKIDALGNSWIAAFERTKPVLQAWKDAYSADFTYVGNHWHEMLDQMWGVFGDFGGKIGESGSFLLSMFQQAFSGVFLWLKKSFNEIWSAVFGHPLFGDAGTTGGAIVEGLGYGSTPKSGGGGAQGREPSNRASGSGRDRGGESPGGGGSMPTGSSAGNLTKLIDEEAKRAGVDPRIMEGIRAGESGHGSKYDVKDDAIESSWGPFQLNRRKGLGVQFEKDTGLDVRDPKTIPAQARWVANYLKTHGTGAWMGFRGMRNADPRWGDSGYVPSKSAEPAANPPPIPPAGAGAAAAGKSSSNMTTNNSSHEAHITINSSTGNPHEIARAVKESIDRTSYAMHGNYSLA